MAGDEDFGSARITIDIDGVDAVDDARDLGLRIQRAIVRATRDTGAQIRRNIQRGLDATSVSIEVEPDLRRFEARLLAGLRDLNGINIPILPDLTRFEADLRAALASIGEVRIRVVPDLTTFDAAIRAHNAPDVTVNANVDSNRLTRALGALGGVAGKLAGPITGLLRLGAVGIAAASAAQGVIGLVAALAPAAGIIAALPAVVLGFQAALGTLKLATLGVGDALGAAFSGDAKKFQEAINGLAPAAQKAVTAVRDLAPELKGVQQAVQQAFFQQFSGDVTAAVKNLLPLKGSLQNIAANFGTAASEGLKFIQSQQALQGLQRLLSGTSAAVGGLAGGVQPLAKGLLDVASSVAAAFGSDLGSGIRNLETDVGNFLSRIAAGGQAVAWVDGALTVFAQLGGIISNVGSILSGVFSAANTSGGGLLNNIQTITKSFAEFINSAAGQTAVSNIFGTVATIAAQLGPILGALVTQLGAIAPALAPVFTAIGPALVNLIDGLGPALAAIAPSLSDIATGLAGAFAAIGPSLGPIGTAIGSTLTALAPLLPVVGELAGVLGTGLAGALQTVALVLQPVVSALTGALLPVLPTIGAAFTDLVTALAPLASGVGQAIADVFTGLAPVFVTLAGALSDVSGSLIAGLVPVLPDLVTAFTEVSGAIAPTVSALVDGLLPVLPGIVDAFTQVVGIMGDLALAVAPVDVALLGMVGALAPVVATFVTGLLPILPTIAEAFASIEKAIVPIIPPIANLVVALAPLVALALQVSTAVLGIAVGFAGFLVLNTVVPIIQGVVTVLAGLLTGITAAVNFVVNLPTLITTALSSFATTVSTFFTGLFTTAGSALSTGFQAVLDFFTALPGQILTALVALPGLLADGLVNVILLALQAALNLFIVWPAQIIGALSSLGSSLLALFTEAFTTTVDALTTFGTSVVTFFSGLPARAGAALAALPGQVSRLFTSAGTSALSAARSTGTSVVNFFNALPGRIGAALSSLGSKLSSAFKSAGSSAISAARTAITGMVAVGRDLVNGLIAGIGQRVSGLISSARNMVGSAISAAKNALKSSSPSKVFIDIGKDVGNGFIIGVDGTAKQVAASVTRVMNGIVKIGRDVGFGFVAGLTGSSSQIKQVTSKIVSDIETAFKGVRTGVDDRLVSLVQTGNTRLQGLAAQRDALVKRIADAQKFAATTAAAAAGAFSLQDLTQNTTVSGSNIILGLQDAVGQVKRFADRIALLKKEGLRNDLLQQVIGLGPDQGAVLAKTLSQQSAATIKKINSLQGQLAGASTRLGKIGADALFDSGKQAGAGFLAGLAAQRKAIEALMLSIAKSMQNAIRTALKIKSPSQVFWNIGWLTGKGLHLGLLDSLGALVSLAGAAARQVTGAVSSEFANLTGTVSAGGVVIPLTRAQRARQDDDGTGGQAGGRKPWKTGTAAAGTTMTNNFTINEVGDGTITAHRVLNRLVASTGVF